MNFSWHTRALLAMASGVTLAFSFPNFNLSLLAWIAPGMLLLASIGATPAQGFAYGYLQGTLFYPICLPWIDTVMRQYGNIDLWSAAGVLALMTVVLAFFTAVFACGIAVASKKNVALACALAPFLWVTAEFGRTHMPIIGFPWNLTGYAASGNLALVQLTTVTGIYGLSFLIVAYSSLLVYAIYAGRQRLWKITLSVTGALTFVAGAGVYLVPSARAGYVAHLVQTNFPQSEEYPANWIQLHASEMDQLERISVGAAASEPGPIIWPEVPAPFSFQDPAFGDRARRIARDARTDFLVGVVDWKRDSAGKWLASNTVLLLNPAGERVFTYDKIHLVPFGEYVPLRRWLTFAGRLTADISDFTPGTAASVGNFPGGRFGVFICYEATFPSEVRKFTRNGAELLVNVSNDGWFGRSAAPAQHLMMARVRAVESRRWLLRDTNNGFTVSVDPYGRIVARMDTDVRGELDAPYDFRTGLTPYALLGDWFAWTCLVVTVFLLGMALSRSGASKLVPQSARPKN